MNINIKKLIEGMAKTYGYTSLKALGIKICYPKSEKYIEKNSVTIFQSNIDYGLTYELFAEFQKPTSPLFIHVKDFTKKFDFKITCYNMPTTKMLKNGINLKFYFEQAIAPRANENVTHPYLNCKEEFKEELLGLLEIPLNKIDINSYSEDPSKEKKVLNGLLRNFQVKEQIEYIK